MECARMSDAVRMIEPLRHPPDCAVRVPGSKSITNRALLIAALAEGASVLDGALFSDDTRHMAQSLRRLGIGVTEEPQHGRFTVPGCGGRIPVAAADLCVGNAGTAARFLLAGVCLGHGRFVIDGSERMRQRPIGDLVAALRDLGAQVSSPTGCPPVTVHAAGLAGGVARVGGSTSSQFLSALLMVAPYAQRDVDIEVVGELIAKPYVDLTHAVMLQFGVRVERLDYGRFHVAHGQRYRSRPYAVEADASSAHYFLAAAALTGGVVRVDGVGYDSIQPDVEFADRLAEMGAEVREDAGGISVRGPVRLRGGIDVDMNRISDTAPTLAVLAAFATGPVRIRNIAHVRHQESDRIAAVAAELRRLGGRVQEHADGWEVEPAPLHGGMVETYDDHRIAMAFALAGLRVPGVGLRNPECVGKTFPDFFVRLEELRR